MFLTPYISSELCFNHMKFVVNFKGMVADNKWHNETNFEKLDNVTQVYAFIFDEQGKVCLIKYKGIWGIPGGTPEKEDNSFEETLIREVREEADINLKNIKRVGYIEVIPREGSKIHYLLRYIAFVKNINEQTEDPAIGEILERKFIDPKDICEYINWGECEFQLNKAIEFKRDIN